MVGQHHLSTWRAISWMQKEQESVSTLLEQDALGQRHRKKVRSCHVKMQERLRNLCLVRQNQRKSWKSFYGQWPGISALIKHSNIFTSSNFTNNILSVFSSNITSSNIFTDHRFLIHSYTLLCKSCEWLCRKGAEIERMLLGRGSNFKSRQLYTVMQQGRTVGGGG